MAAPRKGKRELLAEAEQADRAVSETAKTPAQAFEAAPGSMQRPQYGNYAPSSQVPVSCRISRADRDRLQRYAEERGLKAAQVIRSWLLERMKAEGIR